MMPKGYLDLKYEGAFHAQEEVDAHLADIVGVLGIKIELIDLKSELCMSEKAFDSKSERCRRTYRIRSRSSVDFPLRR
jgi:hypothetical protein